jgi:glutamate/tyrosine decarboxylase-like PLP-dependent enzyme
MKMVGSDRWRNVLGRALDRVNPKILGWAYERAQAMPLLRSQIERKYAEVLAPIEDEIKPYRGRFKAWAVLPARGVSATEIVAEMKLLAEQEHERWQRGYISGAVYHGQPEHVKLLAEVYALHSQSNPLHADVWPSATKYESEIVSMTANLLGARGSDDADSQICGTVTSGGTESILLAMKTYRDYARERRGIVIPEIVTAVTAHAAFDKAS